MTKRYAEFPRVWVLLIPVLMWIGPAEAEIEYQLGAGDKLEIRVFNHEELSGEYTIDGSGVLSMALIGPVKVQGLTIEQLEATLVNRLKPDYLVNPRISIQVLNYRPFYILGEVENPDSYPYVHGMTYLNAVAIAGGFTYRAKRDHAMVIRKGDTSGKETRVTMDMLVMPGDQIRIEERFF